MICMFAGIAGDLRRWFNSFLKVRNRPFHDDKFLFTLIEDVGMGISEISKDLVKNRIRTT